jgi:replicative DNA helicase
MSKAHITQRYHFNTVCAGVLRSICKPAEFARLYPFMDEDLFFKDDNNDQAVALRETIKTAKLIFLENSSSVTALKIDALLERFQTLNIDKEKGLSLRGQVQVWMQTSEIKSKMESDDTLDTFISYLKAIQFAKHSNALYKNYQEGKIPEAIKNMETILAQVNKLGESMSEQIDLSPAGVWSFLESNKTQTHVIPVDKLYMGENTQLDKHINGFEKQTLNVIIAPTGGGKSMFCHHLLRRAIAQNMRVHLFCVEDRYKSFIYKFIAAQTGIRMGKLKAMNLQAEEANMVRQAIQNLNKYVKVQFLYGHSIDTIHQLTLEYDTEQRAKGQEPPFIHIVDYTGHIAGFSRGEKTHEKIRAAYAARKDFALKHNKMCFDFAQINREGNKRVREESIITHADLAGAYDLSQVCDNIISINRGPSDITSNTATLHISKARDGEQGKFSVKTDFGSARFDMEYQEVNNPLTSGLANVTNIKTPLF